MGSGTFGARNVCGGGEGGGGHNKNGGGGGERIVVVNGGGGVVTKGGEYQEQDNPRISTQIVSRDGDRNRMAAKPSGFLFGTLLRWAMAMASQIEPRC